MLVMHNPLGGKGVCVDGGMGEGRLGEGWVWVRVGLVKGVYG